MTKYDKLIERLRKPIMYLSTSGSPVYDDTNVKAAAALAAMQEREKEYREALEPFARLADRYDPDDGDDDHAVWSKTAMPTIGQLRRARAALKGDQDA